MDACVGLSIAGETLRRFVPYPCEEKVGKTKLGVPEVYWDGASFNDPEGSIPVRSPHRGVLPT